MSGLPREYAVWERLLEEAKEGAVTVGGGEDGHGEEWRRQVREVSFLSSWFGYDTGRRVGVHELVVRLDE